MTIIEYLNNTKYENLKIIKARYIELGAPNKLVEDIQKDISKYENGKSLYNFSSRVPNSRLNEELVSIQEVLGVRGGKHIIINNKYELKYIKPFHIWTLDIVQ